MSDIRPTPVYQIPWTPKTRLPDIRVSDSKKTDNLLSGTYVSDIVDTAKLAVRNRCVRDGGHGQASTLKLSDTHVSDSENVFNPAVRCHVLITGTQATPMLNIPIFFGFVVVVSFFFIILPVM